MMKFSRWHQNALVLAGLLTILQIFIIWRVNGAIDEIILGGGANLDVLAIIFLPTAGIIWTMKYFARKEEEPGPPASKVEEE